MSGEGGTSRELDQTSTWAVALVCAVIVTISIFLEGALHGMSVVLKKKRKRPLLEALKKIRAELMILGFISLLLSFRQSYITRVCIPQKFANTMLPCHLKNNHGGHHDHIHPIDHDPNEPEPEHHRWLLVAHHRFLAAETSTTECKPDQGPLISIHGLHQLHIFIFFLAVFHVMYSAITMLLGRKRIRGWKVWEREAVENDALRDAQRF